MPFNTITLDDALNNRWDVVIAGSSFAAMFFAQGLSKDKTVLIVERGEFYNHEEIAFERPETRQDIPQENSSKFRKTWVANIMFGGNSNCWWGQTPRFLPDDFRLNTEYGVGVDWPIGYDELERYYGSVEKVMEIAGGGNDHLFHRSTAYSFPAHAPSRSDKVLSANDPMWVPVATARSNGGNRPNCCVNGVCNKCPIDAKFTVQNGSENFAHSNLFVLTGANVREVIYAQKKAEGLSVIISGKTHVIRAQTVALATNAVNNAAILTRSGFEFEALGRFIHEQLSKVVKCNIEFDSFFGGTSITGHYYGAYAGHDRSRSAAVLIENFNFPAQMRAEAGKWAQRLSLKLVAEDIPKPENRVVLDSNGEPMILWTGHSDYAFDGLSSTVKLLPDIINGEIDQVTVGLPNLSEAHIQGTTRMGASATNSVIDERLRLHGFENLFVLGSGAFPSCSPANPTLTLSALSLRAAEAAV